jgi:hypothetical protein
MGYGINFFSLDTLHTTVSENEISLTKSSQFTILSIQPNEPFLALRVPTPYCLFSANMNTDLKLFILLSYDLLLCLSDPTALSHLLKYFVKRYDFPKN